MKKKRVLGAILVPAMIVCMCGCGGNASQNASQNAGNKESSTQNTTSASGESTKTEEKVVAKPESISWWTHSGLAEEEHVKEWDAAFDKLTGVHLEHTQIDNNGYRQKLEAAFAAGTEPNVFDLSCNQQLSLYASQGGIADLTDLIKNSTFYDKVDPAVWEAISVDGRLYGVPSELPSGVVNYIRKDWMDKLGISAPKNYEEYISMLRGFKDKIDECKIPLTAPGLTGAMMLPEFYWGAEADFTIVDGKWVDGMMQDNFVGAMQRLRDAYAEGLIDPEVVTNKTGTCRDKWYAGEVGVFSYWAGKWGNTLDSRLRQNFPNASLVGINVIDETYYRYTDFGVLCIDGRLSEEEVEKVFHYFFETWFDGAEGSKLFYCGIQGVHWEMDDAGHMQYLKTVADPNMAHQSIWGTPWNAPIKFDEPDVFPQPAEMVLTTNAVLEQSGVYKTTTPSSNMLNTINADLEACRAETIAKIVMGQVSVEEGIDAYKKQVIAMGIETVLEEMNAR